MGIETVLYCVIAVLAVALVGVWQCWGEDNTKNEKTIAKWHDDYKDARRREQDAKSKLAALERKVNSFIDNIDEE